MSIPISQKVDLLYKQAFGVTKTDTEANKSPSNEAIASPLLNRGDTLWTQADQIPGVAAATAGIVTAYTGTGAQECVADNTTVPVGGVYPTWKTNLTYWIPAEFGATYSVSVYVDDSGAANPTSTGTQIFGAGSGGTGEFYYNYQSGVLNFIGETIPTALTSSKVLYIVGYRYIGKTGVNNLPDSQIGNLDITNQTVTGQVVDANIILTPNGTGQVVTSGNVTASFFYGNGSQLTGIDSSGIANGTSNVRIPAADGNVELNVDGGLTANVTDTGIVMTNGNLDLGNIIATGTTVGTGNITGGNLNTGGVVAATGNVSGGNITTGAKVVATGNIDSTSGIFNGDGFGLSNIPAANVTGLSLAGIANGTSNINIAQADGNITMGVNGVADIIIVDDAQVDVSKPLNVNGTITAPAFTANTGIFTGDGSGLSAIAGANVTGEVTFAATANAVAGGNVTGQVANAIVSGTVYTAAQPNITSVGTLTSVVVSGTANVAGNVNIGASEISTLAAGTVTTTTTSQTTLASFAVSGVNGIEFLVKGRDATTGNTSVASVLCVTDGSTVDFVTYGQSFLTGSPGVLAVGLSGSDLELLVTPTATNSTVWVTQYRFI